MSQYDGILPKGPYLPCLRLADRALLAGYPWIPQCWYTEYGLKDIECYVKNHIAPQAMYYNPPLVRNKPPGAPAYGEPHLLYTKEQTPWI